MSGQSGLREVTPTELLDIRERHWRKRLEVVSLAAEALDAVLPEHREQALEVLGGVMRRQPDAYHRERVLKRWPAVHVIATTGVAADHYANATFWPKLRELLGVGADQTLSREWGNAFLANLRRLGLPSFEDDGTDAGTRYVGRILMHSGMPTFCLADYFGLLSDRRRMTPGLEPDQFSRWAASRAATRQLPVDVPVSRFLQYGGDFAVDVVTRTFELLDVVASGGNPADVPLPARFREVAQQMWSAGLLSTATRGTVRTSAADDSQPHLVLEPFGRGLVLRLPPVGEAPDGRASWVVNLDGVAQTINTRALLPGLDDVAPTTDVAIARPTREAAVALAGREHLQMAISIVDDRLPLLAFDDDGSAVPERRALRARPTWLLFPGSIDGLRMTGGGAITAESPLPPGWSDWSLVLADLANVTDVGLSGFEAVRSVRRDGSARILSGEPVPGVHTSSGQPVYAALPTVVLPAGLEDARWEVLLQSDDSKVWSRWTSDSGVPIESLWSSTDRPIFGTFTIRVRGPWGRGASRRMTVVDGLNTTFNPQWRRFTRDGLQPVVATVRVTDGVDLSRASIDFAPTDRQTHVRVGAQGAFATLVVTPPHMSVAHQTDVASTSPSIRPIRLFQEDLLADAGTLILDLGSAGEPVLHLRSKGVVVQAIHPAAGRFGTYRFDLGKLVDTIGREAQAELSLDPGGEVTVAAIRPRTLFKSVTLDGGSLEFEGAVAIPGLTALVYATRAPWRAPVQLEIVGGRAELPRWLRDSGDLQVVVRIDDPWAPAPVPEWPEPGTYACVQQEGFVSEDSSEESLLSAFLAGQLAVPDTVEDLDRLWTIRGLIGRLGLGERTTEAADAVDGLLARQPRQALVSIAKSRLPLDAIPSLIVSASLPWADLADAHADEALAWSRRSALPDLLLCAADGEWSDDEIAEASAVCGDVIGDLIAGTDPDAGAGRLGPSTDLYDAEPSIRGELIRPLKLVPKALLDADSRTMAAIAFVDDRRNDKLVWLSKNSRRIVADATKVMELLGHDAAQRALRDRSHPSAESGWRLLPTISLAYAFAARHAARGNGVALTWVRRQQRPWTDLAAVAPAMVTIDLIVAELLTAGYYAQKVKA